MLPGMKIIESKRYRNARTDTYWLTTQGFVYRGHSRAKKVPVEHIELRSAKRLCDRLEAQ